MACTNTWRLAASTTGGSGTYLYEWTKVAGESFINITGSTTTSSCTVVGIGEVGVSGSAVIRCKVSDASDPTIVGYEDYGVTTVHVAEPSLPTDVNLEDVIDEGGIYPAILITERMTGMPHLGQDAVFEDSGTVDVQATITERMTGMPHLGQDAVFEDSGTVDVQITITEGII